MTKPEKHASFEQVALFVFVAMALGSFAFSQKAQAAWVFLVPCAVSLFWRIQRLPPRLVVGARYGAWILVAAAVVLGLIHRLYPILSEETVKRPLLVVGFGLAFFGSLFLLGTAVWAPSDTLFPAGLGMFLIAAFNLSAPHLQVLLMVAGLSSFAYLVFRGRQVESNGEAGPLDLRQVVRLMVPTFFMFVIAWSIIQLLPWLQVRVMEATNRLYTPPTSFYSGLSLNSRLGDLEELQLSQKVVMRVWTSRPQKLRGRVFTQFDGQSWHAPERQEKNLMPVLHDFSNEQPGGKGSVEGSNLARWLDSLPGSLFQMPGANSRKAEEAGGVRTKIVQTVFNNGMLVSPGNKLLVRLPALYLRLDSFEDVSPPPVSSIEIYGVVNRLNGNVVQEGISSSELTSKCLDLPGDTDPRLKELARRLAIGTNSPAERIQRTLNYLQGQCQYSLKVGKFHSHQPVAEFLFEKKQGYCEYFASAAAVLLRLEGIPSRYVTGFNVQDGNRQGSHFVVREADAHAWVEAYLPNDGWVEVDPTPEAEYLALHSQPKDHWLAATTEWLGAGWAEISARLAQGDWLVTFHWIWEFIKALPGAMIVGWRPFVFLLFALILAVKFLLKRRRRMSLAESAPSHSLHVAASTPPQLIELMSRLDQIWAREGFNRPASHAPLEHLGSIPPEKISTSLRESSRRIIECFYRTSFGGAPFTPSEAGDLRRLLEQGETIRET